MALKKKKPEEPEKDDSERWLLTYSDLITLLMLFFIIMYAMSTVTQEKFEQLTETLNIAFTTGYTLFKQSNSSTDQLNRQGINKGSYEKSGTVPSTSRKLFLSRTYKEALSILSEEMKERKVQIDINERGIVISLSGDVYFKKGSADLDIDKARSVIEKIALLLTKTENRSYSIRIEGHTDNSPTDPNGPWPTNWHLGAGRAISVLSLLVDYGVAPQRLSIASYGEYRPIFPNTDEEHRSKNRRVDIAILREE